MWAACSTQIDNGYFDEEGLEVELVQFTSGATELAAMASGQINIGYLGVGAHVFAPQGQCAILALDSTDMSGEILVRADSGIKTMADLKGKNIGISAGTTSELVFSMALKLNDMQKSDVTMINMDASGKVTAFMSGQIDAISIEAPYTRSDSCGFGRRERSHDFRQQGFPARSSVHQQLGDDQRLSG